MAATLMDSVMSSMGPQVLGPLASHLGVSSDTVQRGLQSSSAAILSGLASKADEPGFLGQIFGMVTNPANTQGAVSSLTSNIGSAISGASPSSLMDMGSRFRMIINKVNVVEPQALPKLPVACALWKPQPDFEIGAGAWILAGGTHHSSFSFALAEEHLADYAEIAGIELLKINNDTTIDNFKFQMRVNEVYYMLDGALK